MGFNPMAFAWENVARREMKITVYSLPDCVQCNQTKKVFDRENVTYNSIDLATDDEAMAKVREMGYASAPVIVAGDKHWSGFRIEKIKSVIKEIEAEIRLVMEAPPTFLLG